MLNIALMDYDVKHIHSLKKALKNYNASATVISNIQQILDFHRDDTLKNCSLARHVCAFASEIKFLRMRKTLRKSVLSRKAMKMNVRRTPHIEWNTVKPNNEFFSDIKDRHFHFVHSYNDTEKTIKSTMNHKNVASPHLHRKWNIVEYQFHPEKSISGMAFLKKFIKFADGC